MKRTFSYLVFLILLVIIVAFGYQVMREEEPEIPREEMADTATATQPTEKPKVFASDRLGVSFSYPGTWTAKPVEDPNDYDALFLGADERCTTDCRGIHMQVISKDGADGFFPKLEPLFSQPGVKETGDYLFLEKNPGEVEGLTLESQALLISNKKDTFYIFQISENYLETSQIIRESFQEIPRLTYIPPVPPSDGREFKFESCGNLDSYASQPFYQDLLGRLPSLQRYHQPYLMKAKGFTKISKEQVTDVCFSQAGNIIVMLLKSDAECERGAIVKYETDTGKVALADFSPATLSRCTMLTGFGKRVGRFILVNLADEKRRLFYDYIDNILYAKK